MKKDTITYINKKHISKFIKLRYEYLRIGEKFNKEAEDIKDLILKSLRAYSDKYPVDFIIETCTHFGDCPSILYDDNGLFAVVCDGIQPVVTGKQKITGPMQFFPEKKQWKKTIREAVNYYLKR